jgi:tetratricopeptide (TPR) repeat protein
MYRMLVGLVMIGLMAARPAAAQEAQLGQTTFPTSGDAEAQAAFMEGLLLLHSFEYPDARAAFQEAQQIDPDFAMAYWGEAMTHNHPLWFRQDAEAARAALNELAPTPEARLAEAPTEREKDYLRAVHILYGDGTKQARDDAYAEFMGTLAERYPDDLDAQAFHALAILGTSHDGRDFRTYMRAAAIVEEVFDQNPQHPGAAHYLIHSYDDPVHAPLGLRPARVYADIAPAAAHALHMPSHIFTALGMWDRSVEMNQRSWQASVDRMKEQDLSIAARSYHALWWLAYGQLQQGRYDAARATLGTVDDALKQEKAGTHRYHFVRMRAAYLVDTQDWTHPVTEVEVDHEQLSLTDVALDQFAMGWHALEQEGPEAAQRVLDALRSRMADADESSDAAEVMALELDALIRQAQGQSDEAVARMEEATARADAMSLTYGPPIPVKPSHELFGDLLLDLNRPAEAQAQYQKALDRAPKRAQSLLGLARAASQAGDAETAQEAAATLRSIWDDADPSVREALQTALSVRAE